MAFLDIYPESRQVDQQAQHGDGEEFQLQVERQDLEEHLDFALQHGSQDQQLHDGLLLLLFLSTYLCEGSIIGLVQKHAPRILYKIKLLTDVHHAISTVRSINLDHARQNAYKNPNRCHRDTTYHAREATYSGVPFAELVDLSEYLYRM